MFILAYFGEGTSTKVFHLLYDEHLIEMLTTIAIHLLCFCA